MNGAEFLKENNPDLLKKLRAEGRFLEPEEQRQKYIEHLVNDFLAHKKLHSRLLSELDEADKVYFVDKITAALERLEQRKK